MHLYLSRHHQGRSMVMFRGQLAHLDPQSWRRCIYWLYSSSQVCSVWERQSIRSSHPPPFGLNPGDATGTQGIGARLAGTWWLHHHLLNHFGPFIHQHELNLLPSPGIPTLRWQKNHLFFMLVRTVPASSHLLALQLNQSLAGLRVPGRPLYTDPDFKFQSKWRDGNTRGRSLIGRSGLITPPLR